MTNKTKTFSLLLAGTFLTSSAFAADTLNFGADNLNTLDRLKWSNVDVAGENTFEIQTPDGIKYLKYNYKTPDNFAIINFKNSYGYFIHQGNIINGIRQDETDSAQQHDGYIAQSDFINNNIITNTPYYSYGGGILLSEYNPQISDSVFIGNSIKSSASSSLLRPDTSLWQNTNTETDGGALAWFGTQGNISGHFVQNSVEAENTHVFGGAIGIYYPPANNYSNNDTVDISGNFVGNYVKSANNSARGGAVGDGRNGYILRITDSNFINNYASGVNALGGAVYTESNLTVTAENSDVYFLGNYVESHGTITPNDIYQYDSYVSLEPATGHSIYLDGGIDGYSYSTYIGSGFAASTGTVYMANSIRNAYSVRINNGATLKFVKGARGQGEIIGNTILQNYGGTFDLNNGYIETVKVANYYSNGGILHIDVDPVNNTSDKLEVSGDVSGTTDVVVYTLSSALPSQSIVFATAKTGGNADSFKLASGSVPVVVYANPIDYHYDVHYNQAEDGSREWYFAAAPEPEEPETPDEPVVTPPDDNKPDNKPSKPLAYRAEVIAGMGLHEAAIEQTRSVVRNVRTKVADGRIYCPNCGIYDYAWNGNNIRNIWVNVQGETATIDKPVKMDADIWGVEAGFDIQNDVNNTLGVFASYRKGEYDLSGKADKVRSNVGSEIDIDSYLAGLYYRYDKNMNWLFATVYGGVQQTDAKTGDGIAKFDTDGIEFGASIEAGHTFALSNDLTLDPSLGLYYTQINFDDAKDNVGKEYSWKDIKHLEAELGAKLEKQIDTAKVYVKPSVIQTVTSGDSVRITGLNKLSTYDDQTLGRIELGGRYGFTDALSAYGWVNYTFGSDYDATAFGVGVNYAW